MSTSTFVLDTELRAALLRQLALEWRDLNSTYFKSVLAHPQIVLSPSLSVLGRWRFETRTLEISEALVLEQPWGSVVEVLKHEMAHQYVHEVLRETHESAHGPAFRAVCDRFGFDRAAAGMPRSSEEHKTMARITRLLALAESPNVHEAEAAMAAAQKLMLKHNLEVRSQAARLGYDFRHIGQPTGRVGSAERTLAMLLGKYFFVEVIWVPVYKPLEGKRASVLEACGTPENLDIAEYVHHYLSETAERLWLDHKRARRLTRNGDRRTFLAGVMAGFAEKLARQARSHEEQGLVWVQDGDLHDYLRRRHPYIRHVRRLGPRQDETFAHGREAGAGIILHRGVRAPANDQGRLLPAKSSS